MKRETERASAVERAFVEHLRRTSLHASELRASATRELVVAVNQAHELGWSQRRIGSALGRSQPEIARLLKLVAEGADQRHDAVPLLTVLLRDRRDEIVEAAGRRGIRNVRVFGSVARGEDTSESDVDLLVDLDPGVGLFALGALEVELEEMLGREVDVVIARALRESVAATIEAIPL
ncbi:nucleotidyltransferase domain-containing protein [Promicromonospora sp. Populi]|uniref:nucleotidyltransferase domain-containing protein n=1 Tax=Promicromonospora sp. Populi TaxID=3239420 RepID=UPI0034E2220D